ncbi:EamA family transporter [bacterium]|nr:EamA family transporter [bacterium]
MRLFGLTCLVMLAFAANSVLNRMAVGTGLIAPVPFAVVRLAAGALALGGLLLMRRGGGRRWPGWRGRLPGVLGLLVYLFGFSAAYLNLDAGTGALILFGVVQVTMFAGALWSREALPPRRIGGAALALVGLALLVSPRGGAFWPEVWMALAGMGWGIYSLAGRGQRDALAASAWNFGLALPVGLVVLARAPGHWSAEGLALAALSGAVTSGMGYALWYAVVPRLGAGRAATAQLTVPLIAALGGFALLAELPGPGFWRAAVLVLGGVALASVAPRRAP